MEGKLPFESLLLRRQNTMMSTNVPRKQSSPPPQSVYLNYLRGWLGAMSLISFANGMQSFVDMKFLHKSIYTNSTGSVNPLMARIFGTWSLLSAFLRISCSLDFSNSMLYHMTLVSFLMSSGHFLSELLWFQTAGTGTGILVQLLFSGLSTIAMVVGYWFLNSDYKPTKNS
ncbi:ergosterol biosynthetic protein 28 homolog [Octopus bimaculoides]|uniref:Ergosterol biosynthetic protein 28 n=1 Tax=Octopus bimaculoides TaxID=37653 RepID=A0A0L8GIF4_OCTBM|nr:ergosterol biosynthetic protein 28 homolog [Octopus bimaculoides]|eukprot:XP_014780849.1 PREDICTED: probable ergosterol biosynthetic protein 28 isoform X1 [Octopus bimaculoides]